MGNDSRNEKIETRKKQYCASNIEWQKWIGSACVAHGHALNEIEDAAVVTAAHWLPNQIQTSKSFRIYFFLVLEKQKEKREREKKNGNFFFALISRHIEWRKWLAAMRIILRGN